MGRGCVAGAAGADLALLWLGVALSGIYAVLTYTDRRGARIGVLMGTAYLFTREAVIARELYEQCVRHTLITYPWPFATKYAVLVLTATQPSNQASARPA